MADVNKSVLIRAVLRMAKKKGRAWLNAELDRVIEASLAGAVTIKSLSFEGGSASGDAEISTAILLEVFTAAVEQLDGENKHTGGVVRPRFFRIPL